MHLPQVTLWVALAIGFGAVAGGAVRFRAQYASLKRRINAHDERLLAFFDSTDEFTIALDPDLRIHHASPAVTLYDINPSEIQGKRIDELFAPEASELIADLVQAANASRHGIAPVSTNLVLLPRGDSRYFKISAYQDRLTYPVRTILMMCDVTAVHALSTGLTQFEHHAAVAQLSAGVAHNFNNILASIMLNAELIAHADAEEQALLIQRISQSAERGATLSRGLLTFARGQEPRRQPVQIQSVITDLLLLCGTEANRRGVQIVTNADPTLIVYGDSVQIQQILVDIIFNACDAAKRGGLIRISATCRDEQVYIAVANNGEPIPPAHLPLIFLPFFSSHGGHQVGRGLSLPACLTLAQGMNGTITVESPPDGETIFTLILPACTI